MAVENAEVGAAAGFAALARADWDRARTALTAALEAGDESPEVLDALGRALWWLRDAEGAVVQRERAYAGFRRQGELSRAARIALWLSREYAIVWRNDAAANGWLARAERLLATVAPGTDHGWLALAHSERATEPREAVALAEHALRMVDEGLARLDEAMAAATSGEPSTLETFADVCCTLMLACERAGDDERPRQWSEVFESFVRTYDHVPLLAFCRTCGADVSAANGRIDAAERELLAALRELTDAHQHARCVHPAARLAEIRVLQGRFDEAEQLLAGFEEEPEAVQAAVALRLARDEPEAAVRLLQRRLAQVNASSLPAVPLLTQLAEAQLSAGRVAAAREAASQLEEIAAATGRDRVQAAALLASGRVGLAAGAADAAANLQAAVDAFARLRLELDAARARVILARSLVRSSPTVAVDLLRRAGAELEAMGAMRDADEAAALLRSLGVKGRAGPKDYGKLSRRELEVLRLLGEGLSNAEIAKRLFISAKTAEHHTGRIYAKLGLAGRAEAAAYAARNLGSK